jgi:hypothetical protein
MSTATAFVSRAAGTTAVSWVALRTVALNKVADPLVDQTTYVLV